MSQILETTTSATRTSDNERRLQSDEFDSRLERISDMYRVAAGSKTPQFPSITVAFEFNILKIGFRLLGH